MHKHMWIAGFGLLLLASLACNFLLLQPEPADVVKENRNDGAIKLIAPLSSASDQNPAFSPDGDRLVFTRFARGYNRGPAALYILDLDSHQITRLTPEEDQDNVNLPGSAWDEGSDRIVFASDRQEADDLWWIAPDGGDFARITQHRGMPWYTEPSWSPDGEWIVFQAAQPGESEDGEVAHIWKVRQDGSGLTVLTEDARYDDRQPNWSPAGDLILFQRRTLPDGQWDIYTMTPEGDQITNLTRNPASDTDASWSPDGDWIVSSSDYGGIPTPNLFAFPLNGGEPIRITFDDFNEDGAPSWSPDKTQIVFESHYMQEEETSSSLWIIEVPLLSSTSFFRYHLFLLSPFILEVWRL